MALTLNIPLFTVSSLQALAGKKDKVISIMDARSKRVYIGVYDKGVEVVKDTIFTLEELKKYQYDEKQVEVVHAEEVIETPDKPNKKRFR